LKLLSPSPLLLSLLLSLAFFTLLKQGVENQELGSLLLLHQQGCQQGKLGRPRRFAEGRIQTPKRKGKKKRDDLCVICVRKGCLNRMNLCEWGDVGVKWYLLALHQNSWCRGARPLSGKINGFFDFVILCNQSLVC